MRASSGRQTKCGDIVSESRKKERRQEYASEEQVKRFVKAVKGADDNARNPVAAMQRLFGSDYDDPALEWMRGTVLWDISTIFSEIAKVSLDKKEKLKAALNGLEKLYESDIGEKLNFVDEQCTEEEWQDILRILAVRLEFIEETRQTLASSFGFYTREGYLPYADSDYWKRRGLGWMQGSVFEDIKIALDKELYRAISVKAVKPDATIWMGIGRLENLEKAILFVQGTYQREANRLRGKDILNDAEMEKIDILESRAFLANRYLWTLLKEAVAPMCDVTAVTIAGDVIYVSMEE